MITWAHVRKEYHSISVCCDTSYHFALFYIGKHWHTQTFAFVRVAMIISGIEMCVCFSSWIEFVVVVVDDDDDELDFMGDVLHEKVHAVIHLYVNMLWYSQHWSAECEFKSAIAITRCLLFGKCLSFSLSFPLSLWLYVSVVVYLFKLVVCLFVFIMPITWLLLAKSFEILHMHIWEILGCWLHKNTHTPMMHCTFRKCVARFTNGTKATQWMNTCSFSSGFKHVNEKPITRPFTQIILHADSLSLSLSLLTHSLIHLHFVVVIVGVVACVVVGVNSHPIYFYTLSKTSVLHYTEIIHRKMETKSLWIEVNFESNIISWCRE